jgi:hypothetical protein
MRALALIPALALASLPGAGWAQTAEGQAAEPSKEGYSATVSGPRPSPEHTQDRNFAGTRFWLVDPGRFEVESWWDQKLKRDGSSENLLQLEVEIGIAPHLQLDLYQNFKVGAEGFTVEGNQLELRYSFARHYDDILLNPVLYLEWHPRHGAQDRAEARLLLGGDVGVRGLWAANVFYEQNIDDFEKPYAEGTDTELGATGAFSWAVWDRYLRVGAEVKAGLDQHGTPTYYPMALAGPNVLLKVPDADLKLTATAFFGLSEHDPRMRLLVIAGWGF